ncbi:hypothetical protein BCR36DRAFT_300878 [Piromyces finnis]|uniref:L domain-like protein n=1 Tax=Piromyces finnis TaxID=1754191 RepID=A0A1Y1V142_9FUNG|nr:hypothetical protein BCR36DRAFT_300878 [Piromyces finnis]|eukprot:ORX44883.1 hypothetical protein BCR36DRAFT_300878 [Piromyces finnis]
MSDIQVQIKNILNDDNEPKLVKEESKTFIDSLLDEKSFTSIENLKLDDNENTIINNSYITDSDGKKTSFLDLLKNNNNESTNNISNNNNNSDNNNTNNVNNDNENNDHSKAHLKFPSHIYTHHKITSIDDESIEYLVNNQFLKRIRSNDSIELNHHKSITKLENLDDLTIDIENSSTSISSIKVTDNTTKGMDENKGSLEDDDSQFHSCESINNELNQEISLSIDVNQLNNNDNTIHSINKNILKSDINDAIPSIPHYNKSVEKDNSNMSLSSIKENKLLKESIDLDAIFTKSNNNSNNSNISNIKYNTISKCTCIENENNNPIKKSKFSNYSLNSTASESTGMVLKSSLKKISMFSSDYRQLPRKENHVRILDSVTIINPKEDDRKSNLKKGPFYGFRSLRKSLTPSTTKTNNNQNSKLGEVIITTELLNDVENNNNLIVPKAEENHPSKVDKIISHCRRLSFSKIGKYNNNNNNNNNNNYNNNNSETNSNANSSNNISGSNNSIKTDYDYRKDIEKMRKKYALIEEKPISKYYTLMKLLDMKKTDEEFLALNSLEVYYKKIDILPGEIGDLVNMRYLYLNDNKIRSIPPDIGRLVNLIHLYVYQK